MTMYDFSYVPNIVPFKVDLSYSDSILCRMVHLMQMTPFLFINQEVLEVKKEVIIG